MNKRRSAVSNNIDEHFDQQIFGPISHQLTPVDLWRVQHISVNCSVFVEQFSFELSMKIKSHFIKTFFNAIDFPPTQPPSLRDRSSDCEALWFKFCDGTVRGSQFKKFCRLIPYKHFVNWLLEGGDDVERRKWPIVRLWITRNVWVHPRGKFASHASDINRLLFLLLRQND